MPRMSFKRIEDGLFQISILLEDFDEFLSIYLPQIEGGGVLLEIDQPMQLVTCPITGQTSQKTIFLQGRVETFDMRFFNPSTILESF